MVRAIDEWKINPTHLVTLHHAKIAHLVERVLAKHKVAGSIPVFRSMKKCTNCSEFLTKNETKYCSNECQANHRWKLRKEKIENGTAAPDPVPYKRYLKEVRGHKCEICETAEWRGQPVSLILDHISGNAEDWSLKNLRLICPNCDHQTPTFSGRNKGNGRIKRTQKRHELKQLITK